MSEDRDKILIGKSQFPPFNEEIAEEIAFKLNPVYCRSACPKDKKICCFFCKLNQGCQIRACPGTDRDLARETIHKCPLAIDKNGEPLSDLEVQK